MKLQKIFFGLSVLIFATALFAADEAPKADEPKKDEKKKPDVKVEGKIFSEFYSTYGEKAADTMYGFRVTRAYLTGKAKIDDVWSANLTLDAGVTDANTGTTKFVTASGSPDTTKQAATKSTAYEYFVKNAYFQAAPSFGLIGIVVQGGMIGTPVISMIDDLSQYRWIYNNYLDKSKDLLGFSVDNSADLGASVKVDVMKYGKDNKNAMVSLTGAVSNGEGYKLVDESNGGYKGKAFYGMVTVNPIPELFVNGFVRSEVYGPGLSKTSYGGGAGWRMDLIKIGANVFLGTYETDNSSSKADKKFMVLDSYANVNLKSIIDLPILVMGRYALGQYSQSSTSIKTSDSVKYVTSAGIGYQFNDNMQALLYYERLKPKGPDAENVYVKTEVKF